MTGIDILMTGPMMATVTDKLEAVHRVHRLWEAADREAFLAELAPKVRAIATGVGHEPVDRALIDRLPGLEIIANFGVGYDSVDAAHAAELGIVVTHTPDVLTDETADTAIGLLLMTVRELSAAERHLRAGRWLEKPYRLTPASLTNRSLGIFGLGRIGKAIARRAEGFGMPICYCGRRRQDDVPYRYYGDLTAMARDVDILMAAAPGTADTHHAIGTAVLQALGPSGILINIGRGSVVDEAALAEALKSGTILAAGLDVFENEPQVPADLLALENVVLLPHVGSASLATREAMARLTADNILSWFETGRPLTPVPEAAGPR